MNEKFYTYLWLREESDRFPIGSPYYAGKGSGNRAYEKHDNNKLNPPKNIEYIIVQSFETEEDAFFSEKFLIAFYGRVNNGTGCLINFTDGGEGMSGFVHSEITKQKIGKSGTGRKHSEETKEKIRLANLGKKVSEETLRKMTLASTGKKLSEETKKKISEAGRKRPTVSEETRKKLSEALSGNKNPMFGKRHSEEVRANMSVNRSGNKNYMFGKHHSDETKRKISETKKRNAAQKV
jgi:hypothetical protein